MSGGFRLATTGARLAIGAVVAAAVTTGVVTAIGAPWPSIAREPVSITAQPAPSDTIAACAGPLLVLGRDPSAADTLAVAADQDVVSGAGAADESRLSVPLVPDSTGPEVFTAAPTGRERSEVAAAGSASVADADIRGLAASACQTPLVESWIVGGATTTGSADLLLLSNPGAVAATVDLGVYGADGAQQPDGGRGLVVEPGTQRVVPLAGLVIGEESPVVQVTATGAPVQATLQSSITRTLIAGGVDQVGPAAPAAAVQVVTGVQVTTAPGDEGASDATTVLRVLSADADTTATVTVIGEDGTTTTQEGVPVSAGVPTEVELAGLAVGTYSVRVDAGSPVVAAAWERTGSDAASDFAWYASAPALTAPAVVAVPDGPSPTLTFFNSGTDTALVAVEDLDGGGSSEVTVTAGATVSVDAAAGDVYRLTAPAGSSVHAAVSFSGAGQLAGFPVWPADAAAGALVVWP